MSKLELKELSKTYQSGKNGIQSLSITISDGEFVALVGPTASGKSAVVRMITGLDEISSGELIIDEKVANELQPKDRNVALIAQSNSLYPTSVYDNMAFGLKLRKMPKAEIDARIYDTAKMFGLENSFSTKPKMLTSIQRQRLLLARAVVREPSALIMDEPLSNLDETLKLKLRNDITKLHLRLGITTVYATRNAVEALTLADRIVVLNAGNVEQIGTPIEIYDNPSSIFVATYFGEPRVNLLDGTLADGKLNVNGVELALPEVLLNKIKNDCESCAVTLGVRSEDITVSTDGEFTAKIDSITTADNAKTLTVKIGKAVWTVVADGEFAVGDEIKLKIDFGKAMLFDKQSEKSLFL